MRLGRPVDWRTLARTDALLADLGMTLIRTRRRASGLAQRQMVEIAGPCASLARGSAGQGRDATILVMDEPVRTHQPRVAQLFALIERLASRGVSIVYITHRLDEVFRIGRRITVMRDGKQVTTRPADQ